MAKQTKKSLVKLCDKEMSKLIRERGKCERCGGTGKLDCAHVFGRRNRTLRWDVNNLMALCFQCHFWWHENPTESGGWFRNMWPVRYEYLIKHSNTLTKRTIKDYKELLKTIRSRNFDKLHQ